MRFLTKYGRFSLIFSISFLLCFSSAITPAEITIQRSMDANSVPEPLPDKESERAPITEMINNPDDPIGIRCYAYNPLYEAWQGDQVFQNQTIIENTEVILNGTLVIGAGGNLTLRNVTLRIVCAFDGEHFIVVENGGTFTVEANSTITAASLSKAWYLEAKTGSNLYLRDSHFSHAGWELAPYGSNTGLWINTANTEVLNCTIHDNYFGFYFFEADGSLFANNTVMNCALYGAFWDDSP
ncbi:MAG: right-handed parallel beta-helix repeat-containing protein, partial [Candidatus Hodarchaeales archaeon]